MEDGRSAVGRWGGLQLEDGEDCCWKMGRTTVKCCYIHEVTAAMVTAQDQANKISQHLTDGTDWTQCITNKIRGHKHGLEICWVVSGGNKESRVGHGYDEDTLLTCMTLSKIKILRNESCLFDFENSKFGVTMEEPYSFDITSSL